MGEAEAVFRLIREFRFRDSDSTCVFVQTSRRSERSKILKNVTGKPEYKHFPKITVANQGDNEYVENYDINSKYDRRPKEELLVLEDVSFSQVAKIYRSYWGKDSKVKDDEDESEEENNADSNYLSASSQPSTLCQSNNNYSTAGLPENSDEDEENSDDKFLRVMASKWERGKGPYLPKVFKLKI